MTDQNNSNRSIANSPVPADERRAQLAALIPEAFSDGQLDVAALKRALGGEAMIEGGERYALTWAGKANAYKVLQTPSTATLRPQRDLSVNFDEAQHVFIEGENLEVLKVLQKAYFGKVKLIYIDPPYNTGSDSFIYPDRFQESKEDYLRRINDLADDGTLMREGFFRKNSKESGHYHSNWLSMMLPRLYIARNLLREDGVIFVSCDDNEVHNLRCLMNEVFGESNALLPFIWHLPRGINAGQITRAHEYLVGYARNKDLLERFKRTEIEHSIERCNKKIDRRHPASVIKFPAGIRYEGKNQTLTGKLPGTEGVEILGEMVFENGKLAKDVEVRAGWTMKSMIEDWLNGKSIVDTKGQIIEEFFFRENGKFYSKKILTNDAPKSVLTDVPDTQVGREHVDDLLGADIFEYPKPYQLIQRLVELATTGEDICMDFFAGSAPTFEAVVRANQLDKQNRRSLLVQLPEPTLEGSAARDAGFNSIADISRRRISCVIDILEKGHDLVSKPEVNLGFKSFLLCPSNFKQWRGDGIDTPEQLAEQMQMFAKSEKDGSVVEHILYELLLKFGQELSTPVETLDVAGGKVFAIHQRKMLFVLDTFTEAMIQPMVDMKPREIIVIDGVFHNSDPLKSNLDLQCRDAGIKFTCI
ncbi:MAG TPA: site-specific DNA-methyltransferase [Gallionellaceae bacterium]|nr:site-specific DNA-methyltransferase [Gallionellaceae bacterium]